MSYNGHVEGSSLPYQFRIPDATPTTAGVMSAADKAKLDSLTPGGISSLTVDAPLADSGTAQNPHLYIPNGAIGNVYLTNSSFTLTAGAGLTGGGAVSLGGAGSLALPTIGSAGAVAYPTSITLDAYGRVTAAAAGSAPVSSLTVDAPLADSGTAQNPHLYIPNGAIGNVYLTNSSFTLTAGAGLTGGGAVSLGGSGSLALPTIGSAGAVAYPTSITLDAYGRVTAAAAGIAPASYSATMSTSSVNITGTYANIGLTLTDLPAGTYQIEADVRTQGESSSGNSNAVLRLYNTTSGSAIANSERLTWISRPGNTAGGTTHITEEVFLGATSTIDVQAVAEGLLSFCTANSDSSGYSRIFATLKPV